MPKPGRESINSARQGQNGRSKWEAALTSQRSRSLSWEIVGAEDLKAAVVSVTADGAALLLSKTSDGGALLIQVLVSEGIKPKHYATDMAELNEILENLANVE